MRSGRSTPLSGMVAMLTRPFSRAATPRGGATPGKGAPVLSYSWGGSATNMTQFASTFQPSGAMFAPGYPLEPVEPQRLRSWDFPVGYNYIYTPRAYEHWGFAELKGLADTHDITRLCIETRKDQVEALDWTVGPVDEDNPATDADSRADKAIKFLRHPDGVTPFSTWLRPALEDLLVADCPAFEVRRTRGGELGGIDVIDGSTIKVLIDDTGRRPRPPAPAYEQIIHGRPWVLTIDGQRVNTEDTGKLTFDSQLIYLPRNPRPGHGYGMGVVEQIVMTINTSIRRQTQQLQHFTEGNVPIGFFESSDKSTWTPEQTKTFQEWFNGLLRGNTAQRQMALWLPPGSKYTAINNPPDQGPIDEWLARIVFFAFSLPPTPLVRMMNRATSQTSQEAAADEGKAPLLKWIKRLMDIIIQQRLGYDDLQFQWQIKEELDPEVQSKILDTYVSKGIYSLNMALEDLGKDPIENGDERFVMTTGGPVLLSGILDGSAAAMAQEAHQASLTQSTQKPVDGPNAEEATTLPGGDNRASGGAPTRSTSDSTGEDTTKLGKRRPAREGAAFFRQADAASVRGRSSTSNRAAVDELLRQRGVARRAG